MAGKLETLSGPRLGWMAAGWSHLVKSLFTFAAMAIDADTVTF